MLILNFLKNLILESPRKFLGFILCGVLTWVAVVVNPIKSNHPILHQFELNGRYHYVYATGADNYAIETTKEVIEGDEYVENLYLINGLAGFAAFIFLLTSLIPSFESSREGWEIEKCWKTSHVDMIKTYKEGSDYYYVLKGKLLYQGQESSWSGAVNQVSGFIKNKDLFPKFEGTTQMKRDKTLDKILK